MNSNRTSEPPMFRFTIRDVLWLTVVVAVGLGGVIAYGRAYSEIRRLAAIVDAQESTIADLVKSVDLLQKDRATIKKASPDEN